MTKDITTADLEKFHQLFEKQPVQQVIARAVQNNGVAAASENIAAKSQLDRVFSIELPIGKVTNQKKKWSLLAFFNVEYDATSVCSKVSLQGF